MNTNRITFTLLWCVFLGVGCRPRDEDARLFVHSIASVMGTKHAEGVRDGAQLVERAREVVALNRQAGKVTVDSGRLKLYLVYNGAARAEEFSIVVEYGDILVGYGEKLSVQELTKEEWGRIRGGFDRLSSI